MTIFNRQFEFIDRRNGFRICKTNILNNGQFQSMEAVGLQSGCRFDWLRLNHTEKNQDGQCLSIRHQNPIYDFVNIESFDITKQVDSFIFDRWWIFDRQFFNWILSEWNNPNVKIKNNLKETERLGNGLVWWKLQSVKNDFKVDSLHYFDIDGNQVDSIDYSKTKVKMMLFRRSES
jgi:hypothetical protein